jgi:hypothetical protein
MYDNEEQILALSALLGDLSEDAQRILATALITEVAPIPRPVLPEGIRVEQIGFEPRVRISWDTPLHPDTPGVQVHQSWDRGASWKNLVRDAQSEWVDEPGFGNFVYRVRGYGYNEDGNAHASPWSILFPILVEEEFVPPDPDPDPPSDFVALSCLTNSVEENKALKIPSIRGQRAARTPIGTIGDITRNGWVEGDGDLVKDNLESVVPKGYAQWSSNMHKSIVVRPGTYTWNNVGVRAAADASQLKWGTREYNAPFRTFKDCDFTDIPKEHGLYVSNYEGTQVENCTFLRCGSQGIQFAHRPLPYQQYQEDTLPYAAPPTHNLINTHFVDNAYKGDRPSFNATYFNPGTSENPGILNVENCSFVCDWPEARYDGKKSSGGLVVAHQQGNAPLSQVEMMKEVNIKNCLFDFTKGDRALVALRSVTDVLIEDCCFIARDHALPFVTIDKDYGSMNDTKTRRIKLRNCVADGGVKLNVLLASDENGNQASVKIDIHCPGEEIVVDGTTGQVLSRTAIS